MVKGLPVHKQLILFDGICNLCNTSINYVIKNDRDNIFMFAPLQGATGKLIIEKFHIDITQVDSVLLYTNKEKLKIKSSAALSIASQLKFPINILTICYIIPPILRNWIYDFVAKNRYKWFGKTNNCMMPTDKIKNKFLP